MLGGLCDENGAGQCAAHYIMVRRLGGLGRRAHPILGKRVHWVWYDHGPLIGRWRKLGTSERKESRVVGFVGHYALGSFAGLSKDILAYMPLSRRVL